MKKLAIIITLLLFVGMSVAYATTFGGKVQAEQRHANQTRAFEATDDDGTTVYQWDYTGEYRQVNLPILSAYNDAANALLSTSSSSGISAVLSDSYSLPYVKIAYESGVTTASPIAFTFRVPDDYRTGSSFVVTCSNSTAANGTAISVDWDIVVNRDGNAASTTRYDQTPVSMSLDTNIQEVTLTYATPTDIQAGDLVTLRVWPARGGSYGTPDLYVYGVSFRYTAEW